MIEPTPVSPISAPWEAVGERLGGPRVGVDDSLRRRLADVCDEVSDDDESRAREAGPRLVAVGHRMGHAGTGPAQARLLIRPARPDVPGVCGARPPATTPGSR